MGEEGILYFSQWRKEQGIRRREVVRDIEISSGMSEEEFDILWDSIVDEFYTFCDDNDLLGEMDE